MKNIKIPNRLAEYFIITIIVTLFYYPVLIPFLVYFLHMTGSVLQEYLFIGLILDLMVAYPLSKTLIWIYPKVRRLCRTETEEHKCNNCGCNIDG